MEEEHRDTHGNPIISGLYKDKYFSDRLILIDLKNDSFEFIDANLARTTLKGKISPDIRVMEYLKGYEQVDIQTYINIHQKRLNFFKSKLEQLAQSEKPKSPEQPTETPYRDEHGIER